MIVPKAGPVPIPEQTDILILKSFLPQLELCGHAKRTWPVLILLDWTSRVWGGDKGRYALLEARLESLPHGYALHCHINLSICNLAPPQIVLP